MRTQIFGVIPGPDMASTELLLRETRSYIDGVELRLDYFKTIPFDALQRFIERSDIPVLLTVRRNDQGGAFSKSEKERLELLESLCTLQPAYVDLEYDVPIDFRKKLFKSYPHISFLSSYHDFVQTPKDLDTLYEKIKTPYAHFYKIAVTAQSSVDTMRLLTFIQRRSDQNQLIGISMGEEGTMSRILAPLVGCALTYVALTADPLIPGQIAARDLQEIYHFRKLNRHTAIFGVIGDPVHKSLGHLIHNAVFEKENINAVYLNIRVKTEELSSFFSLAHNLPFKGLSVTMPLKEAVIPFLTETPFLSPLIHACNTIHIKEGRWIGYNTDGIGALNAIEKHTNVSGKHIVFVGAGGAAKALIVEAARRGAFVTVINRTSDKAIEIASAIKGRGGGWELWPQVCQIGYDMIINCIPQGELIEDQWILPEKIAMDIVYVPKNTPFLVKASKKKCHLIYGYEMFIHQALEQLRIWFPQSIDFGRAYTIIEENVLHMLS